jgi:aspartyl-tRNA(Asn)/glutamyl-tRNA(Gln) amidotransferase subunit C
MGFAGLYPSYAHRRSILYRGQLRPQNRVWYRLGEDFGVPMSVDNATVRRIARLARIAVRDDEVEHLRGELNAMLSFVEQLSEVDVASVEPMSSVTPMKMQRRVDDVTDGGIAAAILANAPARQDEFFMVPKVVE